MAAPYTPVEIIEIAKLSQYYAAKAVATGKLFAPEINPMLPKILYTERKSLEWAYNLDNTLSTLQNVANYVYRLCGRFGASAISKLGTGGGIIVNPTTPTSLGVAFEYIRRITAADFTNGTDYNADWIAGYEVFVEWDNGNQRYLTTDQLRYTLSGFTVFIDDGNGNNSFDARTTNADVIMIVLKRFPLGTPVTTTPSVPIIFEYDLTADTEIANIDLSIYDAGQEIAFSIKANGFNYTWASQFEWSDNQPEQPLANTVDTYSLYDFKVIVDKLVCVDQSLNIPI